MFNVNYNPDVLTCLANLSNDEVFTPPDVANKMLNQLPEELWSDKNTTFLDPCTKSGIFLREITKRLLVGLDNEIPDLQERINHILTKQVFGIGITELTALLTRRSLYCSKNANQEFSITDAFSNNDGNILYKDIEHKWKNLKCEYCGASKDLFNRQEFLEQHAYNFIHTENPKELFNMKFDVIIGNPPYQVNDGGGTGDSSKPIYDKFVTSAKKLNPRYLSMIIPSRWLMGGKGLDSFRVEMGQDKKIKFIYDFEDARKCFPGVQIGGGVMYFLRDNNYDGKTKYILEDKNGKKIESDRYLSNDFSSNIFRDGRHVSIISKVFKSNFSSFNKIVSKRKPYGIATDIFNNPNKYGYDNIPSESFEKSVKIYGVKGNKGGAKRKVGYIHRDLTNNRDIYKFKLFHSYAYGSHYTVPPKIIVGKPGEICSETFLSIGPFSSEEEATYCLSYIKTKFFRALLSFNRIQQNISQKTFELIPMQKFDKEFSDKDLYSQYNLSDEEIRLIEDNIQEMK